MLHKKNNSIEWLEFNLLAHHPEIKHGVFLRHGGVSKEPFASLNVSKSFDDHEINVRKNRQLIQETFYLKNLIFGWQVHGNTIIHVKSSEDVLTDCDGLMTQEQNLGLMAMHADCQAALFYDPIHKAISAVHAGWKGQVQNIYQKTILKMGQTFGSNPQNLLVCISPSLGPQNAEFKNYHKEFPREFWQFQIKPNYFDLWAISQYQLEACGILPHHIEIAKIDTFSNSRDFFSYRREKAAGRIDKITGCHGTVIALKKT